MRVLNLECQLEKLENKNMSKFLKDIKEGQMFIFCMKQDYEKYMVYRKLGPSSYLRLKDNEECSLFHLDFATVFIVEDEDYLDENNFKISVKY